MAAAAAVPGSELEQRVAGYRLCRIACSANGSVAYDARDLESGAEVTLITLPTLDERALPNLDWLSDGRFSCFTPIEKLVRNAFETYLVVASAQGEAPAQVLARQGSSWCPR